MFVDTKLKLLMANVTIIMAIVAIAAEAVGKVGVVWLKLLRSTSQAKLKHNAYVTTSSAIARQS